VFEGVVLVDDDFCFGGDVGAAGDDGGDFFRVGEGLKGAFKDGADDGSLFPCLAFGELTGGG